MKVYYYGISFCFDNFDVDSIKCVLESESEYKVSNIVEYRYPFKCWFIDCNERPIGGEHINRPEMMMFNNRYLCFTSFFELTLGEIIKLEKQVKRIVKEHSKEMKK